MQTNMRQSAYRENYHSVRRQWRLSNLCGLQYRRKTTLTNNILYVVHIHIHLFEQYKCHINKTN